MNYTVLSLLYYTFGAFLAGFLCLFFSFILYLFYIHQINDHLAGPPRSSFIFGHVPDIRKYRRTGRTLREYLLDNRLQYGPIYALFLLHRVVVILGDPVYVRDVFIDFQHHVQKDNYVYNKLGFIFGQRGIGYGLVSNIDEKSWRKRRQLMNPAFHRSCLKNFMTDFNQVSNRLLTRMNDVVENKEIVSMVKEFAKVTLDIISQVSFNINIGAIERPDSPFPTAIASYLRGVQASINIPVSSAFLSIFKFRLFQTASQKEQIDAAKFLRKFARECITDRIRDMEADKDVPNDLLNLLVNDKTLSMDDMIDEFLTVFIAGQETTANSLAFTLYEIIKNPDIEARILHEIEDVIGGKECIDFEDLAKLKFLGQVLQEGLRKHPISGGPSRKLDKELTLGGYRILKGNTVATGNYLFSYNPDIWKDPDIFDPERFSLPENILNFSTLYFPFSVGPRSCIGQTLAKFESKVVMARVLQKFKFKLLPGQTARVEERLTITPRDGVMCEVLKR